MQYQTMPFIVPAEIAADIEKIVNALKSTAENQGHSPNDAIQISRPRTKELVPGAVETAFLIFGPGAVWFTKKWFDEFVWPELVKIIGPRSRQAVEYFFTSLEDFRSSGTEVQK